MKFVKIVLPDDMDNIKKTAESAFSLTPDTYKITSMAITTRQFFY